MSRAFVVGNGPSLNFTDLEKLKGEVTYGLNRLHLLFACCANLWRPTQLLLIDMSNIGEKMWYHDVLDHMIDSGYDLVLIRKFEAQVEGYIKDPDNRISYIDTCEKHIEMDVTHPDKPTAWHLPELCKFGSSITTAMQMAALAGHDPIILIGTDLDFTVHIPDTPDPNHFNTEYVTYDRDMVSEVAVARSHATHVYLHQMAKDWADESGRTILNATVGGELEVYERVEYNSLWQ